MHPKLDARKSVKVAAKPRFDPLLSHKQLLRDPEEKALYGAQVAFIRCAHDIRFDIHTNIARQDGLLQLLLPS